MVLKKPGHFWQLLVKREAPCCFAADEHSPHKELDRSPWGQGAAETHPLHGETGHSCESASLFIALFNFLLWQFSFTEITFLSQRKQLFQEKN